MKKRRLDRKDYMILLALGVVFAAAVVGLTQFKYAFGATLDWSDQHWAIPDYFRKLFYETGELFPNYAPHIGGGENIYVLSYYGLFSPVIMLSYLLPFMAMSTYIQISSALLCYLGGALFYRFLRKRWTHLRALLLTVLYFSASPVFFHAHRHIMFVSFLPFLILSLEAVDSFMEGRRRWPLMIWPAVMIFTSWFFSVAGLIAVTVYGVYKYLMMTEKFKLREFVRTGAAFAVRIIVSVMLAGVLLLPTARALMQGRDESNSGVGISDLIPCISTEAIGYSPYSMGMGAFAILAVVAAVMSKNKARRFMGIVFAVISCFPALTYLLNGTMYLEYKVYISFVPLAVILCGDLLDQLKERKLPIKAVAVFAAVIGLSVAFAKMHVSESFTSVAKLGILADAVIVVGMSVIYFFKKSQIPMYIAMLAVPVFSLGPINAAEELVKLEKLEKYNSPAYKYLSDAADKDDTNLWRSAIAEHRDDVVNMIPGGKFYSPYIYSSIHHKGYNDFYFKVMNNENEYRNSALTTRSQNPFFAAFMGERYLISENAEAPFGYERVCAASDGSLYLYRNKNVLPIGRTAPTLGEDVFEELGSAEQMEALTKYIVTGQGGEFEGSVTYCGLVDLPEEDSRIQRTDSGWRITSDKKFNITGKLPIEVPEDKLLVLEMDCDNTVGERIDARVTINGVRNALTAPDWKYYNNNRTFTYVLTPCDTLEYIFTAGDFELTEMQAYLVDRPGEYKGDVLMFDKESMTSDSFSGTIDCAEDTFFELAFPYDVGFAVKVDGKEQPYECVDSSFIGFPISKGSHRVEIEYNAPARKAGVMMSCAGLVCFAGLAAAELAGRRKKKTEE